jgi:uncharacterized damage-inducible protein DinB
VKPPQVLAKLLDDLADTLMELPAELYVATPATGVSGSIGAHVRHVLDHVSAFVAADPSATLSYDRRDRGTSIETDPHAALSQILRLKNALEQQFVRDLAEPVRVTSMIARSGEALTGWSTRARELAFVVSHTIHHQAIIALLMSFQGLAVPAQFGYAPSTPRG